MRRTVVLLAAMVVVLGLSSAGCTGGQQQEAAGNQSTPNGQQQEAEDTTVQHQAECAAGRRSQQPFILSLENDIWTMNLNGSDLLSLTSTESLNGSPVTEDDPAWSPDRKRIAFTRSHYGPATSSATPEAQYSIYVANADGSCQAKLIDANDASGLTWSPDGERIAFSADLSQEGTSSIYVMKADGSGEPMRLTAGGGDVNPAWSPDGTEIAFVSNRSDGRRINNYEDIYVMQACCEENAANKPQRLTDTHGWNRDPVWSPDGTKLAFTYVDFGSAPLYGDSTVRNTDVYTMNSDGSRETRLTHTYSNKHPEHNPVWSPSGSEVAMIRSEGYYGGTPGTGQLSAAIYIMKSDGSDPTIVRTFPDAVVADLDWQ